MPTPALKSLAEKHGVPLSVAEGFWRRAKDEHDGDFKAVMGAVKRMLKNYADGKGKARSFKEAAERATGGSD